MKHHEYYIPQRFIDAISVHLVMNVIAMPPLRPPLILAIHGPAGEGKTEQCRIIFSQMKVWAEWMFADQFENASAGVPAALLKQKYKEMSDFNLAMREGYRTGQPLKHPHRLAALFINDIDLRFGRRDALIQQTVNTQLINALLMGFADAPDMIDGSPASRVPIIMTGNNLGVIYKPLLRDGRAEKFEWKPTSEEKAKVVQRIFPELRDEDVHKLVTEFAQPISRAKDAVTRSGQATAPGFAISSFAALRYHIYKTEVRDWEPGAIDEVVGPYKLKKLPELQLSWRVVTGN